MLLGELLKALCSVLFHPSTCAYSSFSAWVGEVFKRHLRDALRHPTNPPWGKGKRERASTQRELSVNKADARKRQRKQQKLSSSSGKTHGCLQLGRQVPELSALRVLQRLVVRHVLQLHMPAEDQCCRSDLLTNGAVWRSIFNWQREIRWELRVWSEKGKKKKKICRKAAFDESREFLNRPWSAFLKLNRVKTVWHSE